MTTTSKHFFKLKINVIEQLIINGLKISSKKVDSAFEK